MSTVEDDNVINATTRSLQIIIGALTMGPLIFLAIILTNTSRPTSGKPFLIGVGIVLAIAMLVLRLILPWRVAARTRGQLARDAAEGGPGPADLTGTLCGLYRAKTILGAAFIENVAFFMGIVYFVERLLLALVLALVFILGVASHFPTRARIERWIERQRELIEEERQLGR